MTYSTFIKIWKGLLIAILIACAVFFLSGCTYARYSDETKKLTVLNFHPVGESVTLSAEILDTGSLDLNRETESTLDGVASVVDEAVIGI